MSDLPGPNDKPLFLNPIAAATSDYVEATKPDEVPNTAFVDETDNYFVGKPLSARHKEVARLAALGKMTQAEIGRQTNYTPARVWGILQIPAVKEEIRRYRERLYEADMVSRMKDLGPDAVNAIEELLRDPAVKAEKKISTAQWLLEKLTGKAKQEVNVESNTLAAFMETMKQMQQNGEKLDSIDVTPQTQANGEVKQVSGASKFSGWVEDEL